MKKLFTALLLALSLMVPFASGAGDTHGMIELDPQKVENTGLWLCTDWSSTHIGEIKGMLSPDGFAEYSQMRPETLNLYDQKLAVFIQTLCDFCGYENPKAIIDNYVYYAILHLGDLSEDMRSDLKSAYIANLIQTGRDGCLSHAGPAYPYYGWTQTDSDWRYVPYPYGSDWSRTMGSSACGPTAMSIVMSSWFHKEILPLEIAQFSVANGYRLSYGTSEWLYPAAAAAYGMPSPVRITGANVYQLFDGVLNQGNMAVADMQYGHFTHGGHYVAIVGAKMINGRGYFLVADPNYPNSKYYGFGYDMFDEDPSDPFVWASINIFQNESPKIFWFQHNFKTLVPEYKTTEDEILIPYDTPAETETETEETEAITETTYT